MLLQTQIAYTLVEKNNDLSHERMYTRGGFMSRKKKKKISKKR